jgi:glutamate/tyrosine decarboxylase-like PLP-dependent enzyme
MSSGKSISLSTRDPLLLDAADRRELWLQLDRLIEDFISAIPERPVANEMTPPQVRELLAGVDFSKPMAPADALRLAADGMSRTHVQVSHPRYFGLFNPAPSTMGIAADALVAAMNPQLAAWKHAPFAAEVEQLLIRALGERFGYNPRESDGTFASGGSEANQTALLTAITAKFPEWQAQGMRAIKLQPVLYTSAEGHHSIHKFARLTGLGLGAVREIPVNADLQMDVSRLKAALREDRLEGHAPFLVVATAGTTNAGAIDPLPEIAAIAAEENLWLHVDAAWGGAAALVPELRPLLDGIERADSIAFDAHKWFSVPMAAGIYLTRHSEILSRTFGIEAAYVPPKAEGVSDGLAHSLQWSRRFIGLKVFLSLAVAGWDGYAQSLRQMTAVGELLRRELVAAGWKIANQTPLPVVCFTDGRGTHRDAAAYLERIAQEVVGSGEAWISTTRIGANQPVLRACITNFRTTQADIAALVRSLDKARAQVASQ